MRLRRSTGKRNRWAMGLADNPALWLFIAALPVCFFVAWSDLAHMKIPNVAVAALVLIYAVIGALTLPLDSYLWQWTHLPVILILGMAANAAGALGAGDAKFLAAAAPFVAFWDLSLVLVLMCAALLFGVATHRIARASFGPRLAPDWQSWKSGRRFPMGFPLSMTLLGYLALVAASR